MVKTKLVEALKTDGAKLLHQLDRRDFPVEAMAWVHLTDEGFWRLVIASPIVGEQGGTAGYRQLNELLHETELAGITLEDISLFDPASRQFKSLIEAATESSRLAPEGDWLEFEDAIIYRWDAASIKANLACDVSASELNRLWAEERELLPFSLPGLLISVEGRTVTFRFHPQHGHQDRIDGIKLAFELAFHRPSAYPDCQVEWLD